MSSFENRVVIERPLQEVRSFLADPANLPRWNHHVLSTTPVDGGPREGARYLQRRKTDEQELVIERLASDEVVLRTLPPFPELRMAFRLRETGAGTEVVDEWTLGPPFVGIRGAVATVPMKHAVRENLERLRELLERGVTRLQDGRMERLDAVPRARGRGSSQHAPASPAEHGGVEETSAGPTHRGARVLLGT